MEAARDGNVHDDEEAAALYGDGGASLWTSQESRVVFRMQRGAHSDAQMNAHIYRAVDAVARALEDFSLQVGRDNASRR